MQHWSSLKEKAAGFFRLRFMLLIYKIFGRSILQFCIYPVVLSVILTSKKTRKYSYDYLNRIYEFKGKKKEDKPNIFSIFKHVFSFASSLADRTESWSGNVKTSAINIKTRKAFDDIIKHLNSKKGILFIGSHLGNMELFRSIGVLNKDKFGKNDLKINAIIQSNYTKKFNKLIKTINKDSTTNLISATEVDLEQTIVLSDKLQNGEIVVIAADRTAQNNQDKVIEQNFLGKKANFALGPFVMANVMKVPTYFMFCLKQDLKSKNKEHDIYFFEADLKLNESKKIQRENNKKLAQEYGGKLEELCLKYPYQWFNFFDFWRK